MSTSSETLTELIEENTRLKARLAEVENALHAMQRSAGDSINSSTPSDPGSHAPTEQALATERVWRRQIEQAAEVTIEREAARRRRVEEALRTSEERLALVARATNDALYDWDLRTGYTWSNGSYVAQFGIHPSDVEADMRHWLARVHPDERERVKQSLDDALNSDTETWSAEYRFRRADDVYAYVLDRTYLLRDADGRVVRMVGAMFDLTGRRQTEEALRASEEKFAKAFGLSPVMLSITSLADGRLLDVNQSLLEATGYTRAEMLGRTPVELGMWVHPEERDRGLATLRQEGRVLNQEAVFRMKHGDERTCLCSIEILEINGRPCVLTALVDITERKQAEEGLRHQTTLLEALTESVLDGILIVSAQGQILHFNQHFLNIWNFPAEIIASQSDEAALTWAADQTTDPAAFRARVTAIYQQPDQKVREELLMKDGRVYERFGAPIYDGATRLGWVWTFRDITERKKVEERLQWLQAVTVSFANTQTVEQVRRVILNDVLSALGSSAGGLRRVEEQGLVLDDYDLGNQITAETVRRYRHVPLQANHPAAVAARGGEPVFTRNAQECMERYPDLAETVIQHHIEANAHLPLKRGDEVFGVLSLNFTESRAWDESEQAFALALADRAAVAYERARLFEAVRTSEAQLGQMADAMPQLVWVANSAGVVHYYNRRVTEFDGVKQNADGTWNWQPALHPDDIEPTLRAWQQATETEQPYAMEHRLRMADGGFRWHLSRAYPAHDAGGRVVMWYGTATDIHELKNAEAQLRLANERFRIAESASNGFIYDLDLTTNAEERSDGFTTVLGYTNDDVPGVGSAWETLMHPDDVVRVREATQAAIATGAPGARYEYRMRHKEGRWLWVLDENVVARDNNGVPRRIVGSIVDITDRKLSEEALRASEARFRAVQDTSIDGFMVLESVRDDAGHVVDFRWLYANEAAERIVGRPRTWFIGRCLLQEMPGNRDEGLFDAYVRVVETGEPWTHEFEYRHEGLDVYLRLVAAKAGDGFAVTFADLSERRRAEERIRESEAKFRTLADNISQFAWMADEKGWIFWYNQRWHDYTGETLEAMQGWGWRKVHHPDHVERVVERIQHSWDTGERWEDTFPLRGKDGQYRWFLSRAVPIRDGTGRIVRWFGTNTDVTEAREAEEALRTNEARFRALADAMPQIVWTNDATGTVNYLNRRWLDYTGLTLEKSLRDPNVVVHTEDRAIVESAWVENLKHGQPFEYEMRLRRKAGEFRWHLVRCVPARDDEGHITGWYGTSTDIHERKRAEQDAQFLADLGALLNRITDPAELIEATTRMVGTYFGVSRCAIHETDLDGGVIMVERDFHSGVPSLAGAHPLVRFSAEDVTDFAAGQIVVRNDTQSDPRTAKLYELAYAPLNIRAVVVAPMLRMGRLPAALWISHHEPRAWSDNEVELLRTVAERVWLAVENARLMAQTQALNTSLEARVAERTEALRQSQIQLRRLSAHAERARENERGRIAREVHDELGGALTALKMSLVRIRKGHPENAKLTASIQDIIGQTDAMVRSVRRIASDLRPPLLDDLGLLAALEWQAREFQERTGITCHLEMPTQDWDLESDVRTAVFRVFQESLTNIARHAHATQVVASIQQEADQIVLHVQDNGHGISANVLQNGKSFGLLGMRERIQEVFGDFEITSAPGNGAKVTIRVPLTRNADADASGGGGDV